MSISNEMAIEFVRTRIRIRAELIDVHEDVLDTYDVPHSFLMDMYHTDLQDLRRRKIGRASCRERVCLYV